MIITRKIQYSQLPENEKYSNVRNDRKHFMNTIKMIVYCAETSMVNMIRPQMAHPDEARVLLQQIYKTDANVHVTKILKAKTSRAASIRYEGNPRVDSHISGTGSIKRR